MSLQAKDLIRKLLQVDPSKRLTAAEALKHEWFHISHEPTAISQTVINRLRKFRGVSKLKKAVLNMMVKMIDPAEIQDLREEF